MSIRTRICPSRTCGHSHAFQRCGWRKPNRKHENSPSFHWPDGPGDRGSATGDDPDADIADDDDGDGTDEGSLCWCHFWCWSVGSSQPPSSSDKDDDACSNGTSSICPDCTPPCG